MSQIHSEGLILFGQSLSNVDLQEFRLSTSQYPVVVPVPLITVLNFVNLLNLQRDDLLVILNHRILEDEIALREIDSLITDFNGNLSDFRSTLALVATWQIALTVS